MMKIGKTRENEQNGNTGLNDNHHANAFQYESTANSIRELMQLRGKETIDFLREHYNGIDRLAYLLNTDLVVGIKQTDKDDIRKRQIAFGTNEIPPKPPKLFIQLVFDALTDTTLIILIVCAFISIGLSFYHPPDEYMSETTVPYREQNLEWIEGLAIFLAVIVVVLVTALNDWRKERQFRCLQERIEKDNLTSAVRNGDVVQINVKDLVVGDVCCIKYGDLIPADGLLIQSSDLRIDESSLTGEPDLIKKQDNENINLLAGTHVMEGSGRFLVTAVGLNSQTGIIFQLLGATKTVSKPKAADRKKNKKIYKHLNTEEQNNEDIVASRERIKSVKSVQKLSTKSQNRSVLQNKLNKLAIQIGYVGMCSALLTFLLLCSRMAIDEFLIKKNAWSNTYIKYIISFLIQGVTVIVVAVPEGLPLAVTLALAYAVRQMTTDNNLVRHLDACETMGNATTICSDKTGTLTTNRMTVVQGYFGKDLVKKINADLNIAKDLKQLINESIAINTSYTTVLEPPKQPGELAKQLGNKTECALLGLVQQLGGNYVSIRAMHPIESLVKVYTFNSERKTMSTVIKHNNGFRLYSKGASEILLTKCAYILDDNGNAIALDNYKRQDLIHNVVEVMARDGLRTICIGFKDLMPLDKQVMAKAMHTPDWNDETEIVKDLTCLCIVGIEDPVRDEVPDAIKMCQSGGVVVRMVTGDNVNTATSIALKCGIIKPGDDFLVLESKDFNKRIRDSNNVVQQRLLDEVWPKLRVLARSSPQDKYVLVNGIVESKLSANREVVAVTGDGTNDGPALKRADVGFAMGIQGTDVAKEASDIILTDDNFSSIVKAMMWGRNVYDSIAKFLQFQLTANFVAATLSIICAATIKAVPLKAVQMLWVNLVMDTLASLALSTERPDEKLLQRRPYGRTKPIISVSMLKNIILHGIYQLVVILVLIWFAEDWFLIDNVTKYNDITKLREPSQHFTFVFNVFVLMTLFNEINARKIHGERNVFEGIHRNPYFYVIWLICFSGQVLIVNFGNRAFSVVPLDIDHWLWCFFFGIGSLLWGQIVTTIPTKLVKRLLRMKKKPDVVLIDTQTGSMPIDQYREEEEEEEEEDAYDNLSKSKIMWIRGITRIQQQLKVVSAFQTQLDEVRDKCESMTSLKTIDGT